MLVPGTDAMAVLYLATVSEMACSAVLPLAMHWLYFKHLSSRKNKIDASVEQPTRADFLCEIPLVSFRLGPLLVCGVVS